MINKLKITKKLSIAAALLIVSCSGLFAQGGSNYSIMGFGDIDKPAFSAYQGLAGTAIAIPLEKGINTTNPAMMGFNSTTRLLFGYNFNQHLNESGDNVLYQNNGQLSGLSALFAIDSSMGLSLAIGITSNSKMNYLITNKFASTVDNTTLTGSHTFQGKGGISTANIAASFRPLNHLYVGAQGFMNFGSTTKYAHTEFDGALADGYMVTTDDQFDGGGFRLGAYYNGIENLGVGFFYEKQSKMNIDRTLAFDSPAGTDTTITSSLKSPFPDSYGFGLSYTSGKFMFGADYTYTNSSVIDFNMGIDSKFRNSSKISVAAMRIGNTRATADYFDKIAYKAGFSYKQLYYVVQGENINETAFSLGAEMPIAGTGNLDVSFVMGMRGTNNKGLIQEYFGRLYIDMSIGEAWFKPFRRN